MQLRICCNPCSGSSLGRVFQMMYVLRFACLLYLAAPSGAGAKAQTAESLWHLLRKDVDDEEPGEGSGTESLLSSGTAILAALGLNGGAKTSQEFARCVRQLFRQSVPFNFQDAMAVGCLSLMHGGQG